MNLHEHLINTLTNLGITETLNYYYSPAQKNLTFHVEGQQYIATTPLESDAVVRRILTTLSTKIIDRGFVNAVQRGFFYVGLTDQILSPNYLNNFWVSPDGTLRVATTKDQSRDALTIFARPTGSSHYIHKIPYSLQSSAFAESFQNHFRDWVADSYGITEPVLCTIKDGVAYFSPKIDEESLRC